MRAGTTVIGLEVHVQLATDRKLFSGSLRRHDPDAPNAYIDPFSIGLPGALPVPNPDAIDRGVRIALALGCEVHPTSHWDRKHYFYPDLPKGYQITQQRAPLATGGRLEIVDDDGAQRVVRILGVHLEEDAGKSVHGPDGYTRVDFNRAGAPLAEIVTAPDLRSPAEARRLLKRIRAIVAAVGASTAHMEQGELRCDANVSVATTAGPGPRVELKNLNSFRHVEQALTYEVERQAEAHRTGTPVVVETRLWDASRRVSRAIRSKEATADYRYLPEPDLPPLRLSRAWLDAVAAALPEIPSAKSERYLGLGLSRSHAHTLADDPDLADLFDAAAALDPGLASGIAALALGEVARLRNASERSEIRVDAPALVTLARLKAEGRVSSTQQKALLARVWSEGAAALDAPPSQESDPARLGAVVQQTLDRHPDVVDKYRAGKVGVIGFLVGEVMKATRGQASPPVVRRLLEDRLKESP